MRGSAAGWWPAWSPMNACSAAAISGGGVRTGGDASTPNPGLSKGKYTREYSSYGFVRHAPSVRSCQTKFRSRMGTASTSATTS